MLIVVCMPDNVSCLLCPVSVVRLAEILVDTYQSFIIHGDVIDTSNPFNFVTWPLDDVRTRHAWVLHACRRDTWNQEPAAIWRTALAE